MVGESWQPDEIAIVDQTPDDVFIDFSPFASQPRIGTGALLDAIFILLLDGVGVRRHMVEPGHQTQWLRQSGLHDLIDWRKASFKTFPQLRKK